ncbi:toprim domain-containing protein [Geobacter sulfurreducens]|uniref:toprim domain-containing protein n=1 Tax=Geobacter sulfurreducens TaxID=35554 RepID=UPI000DBBA23F|nr:toprim domain-containing protein [Geobacter sulfurreducens]BBA70629.1 DNA primase TraC [Geobacter sulfurreducens]
MNIIEQFREAMSNHGLETTADIIADGNIHRFHVTGDKPRTENGWYSLYVDGDIPAGAFGCWKRGISESWCARSEHTLTPEERERHRRRMEDSKRQRAEELDKLRAECREKCTRIWNNAQPASDENPYLKHKGVHAYGVREIDDTLLVPVRDINGKLHGLQFIPPDGANKKFKKHTAKNGHYHGFGKVKDKTILICEGYATGASLHEATGHAVAVAFDAGNLKSVAVALRHKYPAFRLVICADNDALTDGNPGLSKATDAAQAVNGFLVSPQFVSDNEGGRHE